MRMGWSVTNNPLPAPSTAWYSAWVVSGMFAQSSSARTAPLPNRKKQTPKVLNRVCIGPSSITTYIFVILEGQAVKPT